MDGDLDLKVSCKYKFSEIVGSFKFPILQYIADLFVFYVQWPKFSKIVVSFVFPRLQYIADLVVFYV